jgi:hypothetical protein
MAYSKVKFKAPDVNRTFNDYGFNYSSPDTVKANTKMLMDTSLKYSKIMNVWGIEYNIPNFIINAFICTESAGKNVGRNDYGAIGLMQIKAGTVYETITKWSVYVDIPLSNQIKNILTKNTPSWKSWDKNKKMTTAITSQIETALKKEDYNIALGCASLRWMLEAFSKDGESNINKTIIAYNKGFYGARTSMIGLTTTEELLAKKGLGREPKGYLLKMLGVNGFLDLWFNKVKKK